MKKKVFISTIPFGSTNSLPLELLKKADIEYEINPYGRRIKQEELIAHLEEVDCLVAGTELINEEVLKKTKSLKAISRVGVGIDNIDVEYAKKSGISILTTPDAPSEAVAEYALGLMLSMTRKIYESSILLSEGVWKKNIGTGIQDSTIGVIGAGRIGKKLMKLVSSFSPKKILFFDPLFDEDLQEIKATNVSFNFLIENSDIISIHVPLSQSTKGLISISELKAMKSNSLIINTSRGGIVNEKDLYTALNENMIGGAAIDVFTEEPYKGDLIGLENCLLTPHISSMTAVSREKMEIDAVEQAIEYLKNS